MSGAVHTIWVPTGWSPEQAWEAIRRGEGTLLDQSAGAWVNIIEDTYEVVIEPDEE